ncbi:hypothetical protein JS569_26695, partial [Klebsiella pneumoniae]|uniref:hypothetical protein n=1 Tax=Klebsiella pneumoniae TaxID=573 RepID=UPI0019528A43
VGIAFVSYFFVFIVDVEGFVIEEGSGVGFGAGFCWYIVCYLIFIIVIGVMLFDYLLLNFLY